MTTITKERIELFVKSPLENGLTRGEQMELARIALASRDAETVRYLNKFSGTCVTLEQQPNAADDVAVYIPLYAAPPVPERERIRREHAEWSDKTFGDVGPVGPLKHLSKEALEAAAEPDDLSEWADMQFLLWDAQRRAGITDEQITQAMVEKLAVNKKREWPEPKDGEPRLHIKEQSAPVIPDGWISCSERMPEDEQEVIVHNKLGYRYVSYFDEHSGLFFDMRGGNQMNCIEHILVTHWMPLPAAPEPEQS
ncbi:dATP/dGTP pyrophosphohydrolase domain-containing protein [Salmonella enterica]